MRLPAIIFKPVSLSRPHIWGALGLLLLILISLTGCGLPDYVSLEKPVILSDSYTESNTVVGFQTPADPNITGYIVYYIHSLLKI